VSSLEFEIKNSCYFSGMYKTYLANIRLPSNAVDFFLVDVSRLEKRTYDSTFRQQILDAKPITIKSLIEGVSLTFSLKKDRKAREMLI
jgi:hypothetical protein